MSANSPERKYLHETATHMTVVSLVLKKTLAELAEAGKAGSPAKATTLARLEKAIEAMKRLEKLHADRKSAIS